MNCAKRTILTLGILGIGSLAWAGDEDDASALLKMEEGGLDRLAKAVTALAGDDLPELQVRAKVHDERVSSKQAELEQARQRLQALEQEQKLAPSRYAKRPDLLQTATRIIDGKVAHQKGRIAQLTAAINETQSTLDQYHASIRVEEAASETPSAEEQAKQLQREHETRIADRFGSVQDLLDASPVGDRD